MYQTAKGDTTCNRCGETAGIIDTSTGKTWCPACLSTETGRVVRHFDSTDKILRERNRSSGVDYGMAAEIQLGQRRAAARWHGGWDRVLLVEAR